MLEKYAEEQEQRDIEPEAPGQETNDMIVSEEEEPVMELEEPDMPAAEEVYYLSRYDGNGKCIKEENYDADGSLQQVWER